MCLPVAATLELSGQPDNGWHALLIDTTQRMASPGISALLWFRASAYVCSRSSLDSSWPALQR
eukprot:5534102-Alexandrium_andersonii.AAC.1